MAGCYICMDKGFIEYTRKIHGLDYEFISHCTCSRGLQYQYDGTKLVKNKNPYYVPCVSHVLDVAALIEANKRKEREAIELRRKYQNQQAG